MMQKQQSRIFAGWWVVAGAFLCMMTGFAVAYSFAAFFGALESEFGARRGETSLVFSIAAGLAAAAQASSLWQVYLGYGVGVGVGVGLSYVPSIAAVQRWFVRRRGTASGLAISGIGVGTLIGAPLAHELIA